MANLRLRLLSWWMRQTPTHCRWGDCKKPLPKAAINGRYCSEECADQAWEFNQI